MDSLQIAKLPPGQLAVLVALEQVDYWANEMTSNRANARRRAYTCLRPWLGIAAQLVAGRPLTIAQRQQLADEAHWCSPILFAEKIRQDPKYMAR